MAEHDLLDQESEAGVTRLASSLAITLIAVTALAFASRSPKWRSVRDRHVASFPYCAVCGCEKKLEAHHIVPFSVDASLELDTNNLVVLCRQGGSGCHYWVGHGGVSWIYENSNLVWMASNFVGKALYENRANRR